MFKNLAKPEETIVEHTLECFAVAKQLSSIFKNELRLLDQTGIRGEDIFLLSVLFHDFGKYAQPFQNITLNMETNKVWGYRHEVFSAEFVNLLNFPKEAKQLIQLGILAHHNKTINILEKATFKEQPISFLGWC